MDKKSLFVGMGLGAVIAFSGMMLGGMQARQQDREDLVPDADITRTDVVRCREIQMLGPKGQLAMKISGTEAGGVISVLDSVGQESVRVASSLHAGGKVIARYRGKPAVTVSANKPGGAVQVYNSKEEPGIPVIEMVATPNGEGWIGTKNIERAITAQMPDLMSTGN